MSRMDTGVLTQRSECEWEIPRHGAMRVPAVIYANEALVRDMDHKVYEQAVNVATLPGIVGASYAMPDAHWGYGFPIGGVAAFDAEEGVISPGGVGYDINCGVRLLRCALEHTDGPFSLRYPRDKAPGAAPPAAEVAPIRYGTWDVLRKGKECALLAVGVMCQPALAAAKELAAERLGGDDE